MIDGPRGILNSKKGTMCALILAASVWLCAKGRLDGTQFAAIVASVVTLYTWTQHRIDLQKGAQAAVAAPEGTMQAGAPQ